MKRHDNRRPTQHRPVTIQRHFTKHAGGSVVVSFGETRVLCTAMLEQEVPPWLRAKGPGGGGWLTAEYNMLPSSTTTRKRRDSGKPDGRSVEIQRLIGRALRSCIDLKQLEGPKCGLTLFVDCDVLQADGGTRTAAITGAWVAVADAIARARNSGLLSATAKPLINQVAAISIGIVNGVPVLDLDYAEDVDAYVDMNVAMLADNTFVEVQGTGEHATFSTKQLNEMLSMAQKGIRSLHKLQRAAMK
ncbi:MAG: ribonuclease PH [Phycisphaerales bacterium]|nr:ribonuclease PH [Phycisphaerales bacterium]